MKERVRYQHIIRRVPAIINESGTTGPGWIVDSLDSVKVGERVSFLVHPKGIHCASNVLTFDAKTGIIETRTTVYIPWVAHLQGHRSYPEMISTHLHAWRSALTAAKANNPEDTHYYYDHELKALDHILDATHVELTADPVAVFEKHADLASQLKTAKELLMQFTFQSRNKGHVNGTTYIEAMQFLGNKQ